MKLKKYKQVGFCLRKLVLLTLVVGLKSWSAGPITSGGGDSVAAEFTAIGYQIWENLSHFPISGVEAPAFEKTLRSTYVFSAEEVRFRDQVVDAVNFPQKREILVNRIRWREKSHDLMPKFVMVLHEYLGILGVDDPHYQISRDYFSKGPKTPIIFSYTIYLGKFLREVTKLPYKDKDAPIKFYRLANNSNFVVNLIDVDGKESNMESYSYLGNPEQPGSEYLTINTTFSVGLSSVILNLPLLDTEGEFKRPIMMVGDPGEAVHTGLVECMGEKIKNR